VKNVAMPAPKAGLDVAAQGAKQVFRRGG